MLTSLKVVRIAAVDCDWMRRSATRWRRRVMGTRCSEREPVGIETGADADFAAAGAAAAGEPAPRTSPLVTRPSRPVPWTAEVSRPFSAAILAAEGEAAGAAGAFTGADWAPAFAGVTAGAAAAVAFPSVSITAI